jgi:hypothetical protein
VNTNDGGKRKLIPRPPPTMNPTDFIVVMFAVLIVTVFFIVTMVGLCVALFTDKSVNQLFTVLAETMSTLIAAVVGYMAGRGADRTEKP